MIKTPLVCELQVQYSFLETFRDFHLPWVSGVWGKKGRLRDILICLRRNCFCVTQLLKQGDLINFEAINVEGILSILSYKEQKNYLIHLESPLLSGHFINLRTLFPKQDFPTWKYIFSALRKIKIVWKIKIMQIGENALPLDTTIFLHVFNEFDIWFFSRNLRHWISY